MEWSCYSNLYLYSGIYLFFATYYAAMMFGLLARTEHTLSKKAAIFFSALIFFPLHFIVMIIKFKS